MTDQEKTDKSEKGDQEELNKVAEELQRIKQEEDIDVEQLKDAVMLENVTKTVFESEKDINALKDYLDKVTSHDVTLANFTPQQIQGLTKVMAIDKMYLEPCDQIDEEENNCKQMVRISVRLSKSKEGFAIETLREMLNTKSRIETEKNEPENLATKQKGGKEENGDN